MADQTAPTEDEMSAETKLSQGAPRPTRACRELPDEDALQAAGLNSLKLADARLILVLLSHLIADSEGLARDTTWQAIKLLIPLARTPYEFNDVVSPAPHPHLGDSWSTGVTVMRQLGIESLQIDSYWTATHGKFDDPCLPLAWVLKFAPAPLWPMVCTVLAWGPQETLRRTEAVVREMAHTMTARPNRRRPAGATISSHTIKSRLTALWKLLSLAEELNTELGLKVSPDLDARLLAKWTLVPKKPDAEKLGALRARLDTAGPDAEVAAKKLKALVEALEKTKRGQFGAMRRLLLFSLLCLLGPRIGALLALNIGDYERDHVFYDGTTAPALRFRPGKVTARDLAIWKAIPETIARWIEQWITISGRTLNDVGAPLFVSVKPPTGDAGKRWSKSDAQRLLAGRKGSKKQRPISALLPRSESDPSFGYPPHAYRHLAYSNALRAARRFRVKNPYAVEHASNDDFAAALCDHGIDKLNYANVKEIMEREYLARIVVDEAWACFFGQALERRGLSPTAIRKATEELTRARAGLEYLDAAVKRLTGDKRQLRTRRRRARTPQHRDQLTDRLEELEDEIAEKRDEKELLLLRLPRLEKDLDTAKSEAVELPDDLPEEVYQQQLAEALGAVPEAEALADGQPLAAELTTGEVAALFDKSEMTIRRWRAGVSLPKQGAPWADDAWVEYNRKTILLRVAGLRTELLSPQQLERLTELRRPGLVEQLTRRASHVQQLSGSEAA
jgi:integrase